MGRSHAAMMGVNRRFGLHLPLSVIPAETGVDIAVFLSFLSKGVPYEDESGAKPKYATKPAGVLTTVMALLAPPR